MNVSLRLDLRFGPGVQQYPVMSNNSVKSVTKLTSLRYAAAQQLLGAMDMVFLRDSEGRTMPAKVYPASEEAEAWVVEPPVEDGSAVVEPKTFTGRAALLQAVQYAHDTYGCARFLSR
jgi:hypothetical protein